MQPGLFSAQMIKIYRFSLSVILLAGVLFCNCSEKNSTNPDNDHAQRSNDFLVDTLATAETVALFQNLKQIANQEILFGHQDDLAYGIGWWAEYGRSDVKEVCGDYPAVYGWDLGDIQNSKNLDGIYFEQMKFWIREGFNRGGIITISMHLDNPVTQGDAWDNTPAVASILPGKPHHKSYLQTLGKIADFLEDLKSSKGKYIPVIFRPYHEHNHNWPWWGKSSCTVEEYNALWQMTVEYLRDERNLHHLLYCISPQEIQDENDYFERYPGDDYVDIYGLDYYALYDRSNITDLGQTLDLIARLAEARGKISALSEVGLDKIPINTWWTEYLLTAIKSSVYSRKTAWALVWRNASTNHHFAPYPGHSSAPDFIIFYNDSFTIFESDLNDVYVTH